MRESTEFGCGISRFAQRRGASAPAYPRAAMPLEPTRPVDVMVLGNTTADRVMVVDGPWRAGSKQVAASSTIVPGGEGANVATTLAALGLRVHYLGRFGDDEGGEASRAALEAAGCLLDGCATVTGCPHHHALVVVDRATGERSIVSHRDPRLDLPAEAVGADWVGRARALSLDGQEAAPSLAAARLARDAGTTVFADAERADAALAALVPWVDELVVPLAVLVQLAGPGTSPEKAVRAAAGRGPRVVAGTEGAAGCVALADGEIARVPAQPATVVDTTGAGDAFHAGYIAARLRGSTPGAALRFGSSVAARKCGVPGPRLGSAALADLRAELDQAGAAAASSS
jgi:sulfofructose kinase